MSYNKSILSVLILCNLVCSCRSVSSPKLTTINPATITVEYNKSEQFNEACNIANEYCNNIGKEAKFLNTEEQGISILPKSKILATFACLPKEQKGQCANTSSKTTSIDNLLTKTTTNTPTNK